MLNVYNFTLCMYRNIFFIDYLIFTKIVFIFNKKLFLTISFYSHAHFLSKTWLSTSCQTRIFTLFTHKYTVKLSNFTLLSYLCIIKRKINQLKENDSHF